MWVFKITSKISCTMHDHVHFESSCNILMFENGESNSKQPQGDIHESSKRLLPLWWIGHCLPLLLQFKAYNVSKGSSWHLHLSSLWI